MAVARELEIADEPAAWSALGFAPGDDGAFALGGLRMRLAGREAGTGVVAVRVEGLAAERPDGLPVVAHDGASGAAGETILPRDSSARPAPGSSAPPSPAHPNGALAIDHLVAFTDDVDRTAGALAAAGGDVRRRGGPPELPAPMAFVRFGELIVEVAQAGGAVRFWGLTVTVADLDAVAGPLLDAARPAVQPGRRIATVRREAGLSMALAFMTR
ncbi:MAG TPA: hypothetical protein VK631_24055 [Solirubrobacteraceae bacterium]|nr:hypothetical protein [Solirubrobacteraceae bacterium]